MVHAQAEEQSLLFASQISTSLRLSYRIKGQIFGWKIYYKRVNGNETNISFLRMAASYFVRA